jgi:Na+-translocating ferredoxin:NAD+ oxidoreductase subunit A
MDPGLRRDDEQRQKSKANEHSARPSIPRNAFAREPKTENRKPKTENRKPKTENNLSIPMPDFALILLGAVLVNNFVLAKFLGLCPFMGVSKRLDSAYGMALATGFVLSLSAALTWIVQHWLLIPLGLDHLRTLSFILVIAAVVQFTESVMRSQSPLLYRVLGIFLPLITTNCAVLGVALLNVQGEHSFLGAVVFGFGAALGFGLVLVMFAAMRERLEAAPVPAAFKGAPIGLVTAGLMALAFLGFSGLDRG